VTTRVPVKDISAQRTTNQPGISYRASSSSHLDSNYCQIGSNYNLAEPFVERAHGTKSEKKMG
jgi:hypothetical protein